MKHNMQKLSNSMQCTLWYPSTPTSTILIYFHGGGLIYGTRNDLPSALTNIFLKKQIEVIALDYPLAPNSSLSKILETTFQSFKELYKKVIEPHNFNYILCGRSAGGFIMFWLANQILKLIQIKKPTKIINFYGYYDLKDANRAKKLSTMTISKELIQSIDTKNFIHDDSALSRYLLYLYLAEQGDLLKAYGVNENEVSKYSITIDELKNFPPIFSAASTTDKEVPFSYSKSLKQLSQYNVFYPLYYLNHDFLKEINNPQVQKVLKSLANWI